MRQFVLAVLLFGSIYAKTDKKTLVVILAETRAHKLTYENIKVNLLDVLHADLALCIGVKDTYDYNNSFYRNAKYRFLYPEPVDYATAFDYAYNEILMSPNLSLSNLIYWREYLQLKDQFMGGVLDSANQHPGSGGLLIFYRWYLLKNLLEQGLLDQYDFFVITRSDYIYALPHPSIDLFSDQFFYVPDGEHYGGLTDRHVVLPKQFVIPYLDILNQMILKGTTYYAKMKGFSEWNIERLLAFHLKEHDLFQHVRFFPYVMYTVRAQDGPTRWSIGTYLPEHGYCIKYPSEYESAIKHGADFKKFPTSLRRFYAGRIRKP
jgi:hypothetical protein